MSDTPLTDALAWRMHDHEWCDAEHARDMERDRALLLDALKTTLDCLEMNGFGKAYAMDQAREAIAKVEASK